MENKANYVQPINKIYFAYSEYKESQALNKNRVKCGVVTSLHVFR